MLKSKILFQMTGSIACFKACQIVSKLVQNGYDVQVVMTESALKFVGAATIEGLTGKTPVSDLFQSGNVMDHIHLIRWADLVIVAPASANYINKVSNGLGDDLASTLFLAHDFKKPFLVAPAMNTAMYLHPVTQSSLAKLKGLGIQILETASGVLACGEVGWGRLLEPDLIVKEIQNCINSSESNSNAQDRIPGPMISKKKVLITSGGTQEDIDAVRVLTNKSTGTTGAFLADHFQQMGFDVTYLHSESAALPKTDCHLFSFRTFQDLENRMKTLLNSETFAFVLHLAAVSDFAVKNSTHGKLSSDQDLILELKKNPKLVNHIKLWSINPDVKLVAFKMTATKNQIEIKNKVNQLFESSHADFVIHNDISEIDQKKSIHGFSLHKAKESKAEHGFNKFQMAQLLTSELTKEIL